MDNIELKKLLKDYYVRYNNGYYDYEDYVANVIDDIYYDIFGCYINSKEDKLND